MASCLFANGRRRATRRLRCLCSYEAVSVFGILYVERVQLYYKCFALLISFVLISQDSPKIRMPMNSNKEGNHVIVIICHALSPPNLKQLKII
jgi:hypothetical protein